MESFIELMHLVAAKWYLGLMLSGAVEGLSLPFPSQVLVLYIGHIIKMNSPNMFVVASLFALPYTIASCIPYFIGSKYGSFLLKINPKYQKHITKGELVFSKYGELSVLLTRPFVVGNYISYLAGLYKMNFLRYFCFTFLGIFTWAICILYLGGQIELTFTLLVKLIAKGIQDSIMIFVGIIAFLGFISLYMKYPKKAN